MALRLVSSSTSDIRALVERERRMFAAKLRAARAILGWSQSRLAQRAGLTQRAVHKLEKGETEPRRATVYAIEQIWRDEGLEFESTADGFRLAVSVSALTPDVARRSGQVPRFHAGVTARHHRSRASRSS